MKKINYEDFLDKVHGCWFGKCLGGAAGASNEGVKKIIQIKDFTEVCSPELPNEDLDILDTFKQKRSDAIYSEDEKQALRQSHNNPQIKALYAEFLGEPCGHTSHELLHTTYTEKERFN